MAANVDALIEQGKRAITAGNKEEAQEFLIRATELDEKNENAWLWLASAVDTTEEQRICLENVLVINANNADAQRMLAELDRNAGTTNALTFDGFGDAPPSTPTATGSSVIVEDDDPFGSTFGGSFEVDDSGFSSGGPFSADTSFTAPVGNEVPDFARDPDPEAPLTSPGYEAPEDDDFGSLYDDDVYEAEEIVEDDYDDAEEDIYEEAPVPTSFFGDDDPFVDGDEDDFEEEVDYLNFLPDDIEPTRLPGTDEKSGTGVLVGVVVLAVFNVLAVVALVAQFVL